MLDEQGGSSRRERRPNAVVLVHGIGTHAEGDVLRRVVRSMLLMSSDHQLEAEVQVVHARRSAQAPTAMVRFGSAPVEVVEAYWDDLIPAQRFRSVAFWLAVMAPFTAIELLRAIPRRTHEIAQESRWAGIAWLFGALLTRLVVGVLLFPLWLLPLLLLAAVATLLPGSLGTSALRQLQITLSSTLGDSFVLVDDPVIRTAIIERVANDVAQTLQRCERLVLVGHSQGAHIAMSALRLLPSADQNRCELQTWGSGYRKLRQLELVTDDQPVSAVRASGPDHRAPDTRRASGLGRRRQYSDPLRDSRFGTHVVVDLPDRARLRPHA